MKRPPTHLLVSGEDNLSVVSGNDPRPEVGRQTKDERGPIPEE